MPGFPRTESIKDYVLESMQNLCFCLL